MMATYFNTNGDGGGGSEIQTDSLQTLYLMNPSYSAYASDNTNHHHPEAPPTGPNMLLLNPGNLPHAPTLSAYHHNQHFVGIPLAGGGPSNNPDDPTRSLHEIPTSLQGLVPRLQYNHWNSMDPATSTHGSQAAAHLPTAVAVSSAGGAELGFRRRSVVASALQQQQQQQGLSLSLSPHDQNNNNSNNNYSGQRAQGQVTVVSSGNGCVGDDIRMSRGSPASMSNGVGVPGVHQSVILGSKYLKAAQQLLDEVVNVGDAMKGIDRITKTEKSKGADDASCVVGGEGSSGVACGGSGGGETSNGKRGAELTTAQRQELQMKKAKLLNMVEEVEQRYRQYHNEMQMVVTPFERAAGLGSAKSYTALALQTISKQFRCLKDAIASQIKATSKTLGEDDCHLLSAKVEGTAAGSRLKFVDHQLRQQRALQQLGMIQHNAWRPQRGLPERAVSVLRAWLFEHFLHPYPKDSDKHLLAKQTGLTRSQVSNWFINARVRLWKPMVEEMYLEEIKSQDQNNSNGCESNHNNMIGSTSTHEHNHKDMISSSKSNAAQQQTSLDNCSTGGIMTRIDQQHVQAGGTTKSPRNHHQNLLPHHPTNNMGISNNSTTMSPAAAALHTMPQGFSLIGSPDIDPMDPRSPKKQRSMDMQNSPSSILSMDMEMKPAVGHDHHGRRSDHLGVLKYGAGQHNDHQTQSFMTSQNHDHGFGAYQIGDHLGRFDVTDQLAQRFHGNGVSLTLGLPHNETSNLPFSGAPHHHQQQQQQNFMSGQSMQLGRRLDMGGGTGEADFVGINSGAAQPTHTTSGAYDHNMDMQNRKRFAAPLLPDFVV